MGFIVTLLMKKLSYRESVDKVIHLLHTVPSLKPTCLAARSRLSSICLYTPASVLQKSIACHNSIRQAN